jgi:hypothetical protein
MEYFFQSFQAWEIARKTESKDEEEGEYEQWDQAHESKEIEEKKVYYFWEEGRRS